MTSYEKENAIMKVDGYFLYGVSNKSAAEFERAKAECIMHIQRQIDTIKELSFEDFVKDKKQLKDCILF